jgi:filamentous hemagglutinin family protein
MVSRRFLSLRLAGRCACAGLALTLVSAFAQPSGLTPVHGGATVQGTGAKTIITTINGAGTRHSALDWRSFQVPGGQTVFFLQPNALSTSINRVTGNDPSTLAGTLGSNGRLVLVNPAGIAVAPGAVIDTAGFTASTLAMSRSDAIAGRLRFADEGGTGKEKEKGKGSKDEDDGDQGSSKKAGPLRVEGRILARSGDLVLIGRDIRVESGALLEAPDGSVVLAAGRTVEITGRGLEGIHMELQSRDGDVLNLGTLRGDSVAIFAGQLRHSGLVQAHSATASGGRVVLHGARDVEVRGAIEATAGSSGGSVHVSGDKVVLKSGASIDVRHAGGGGEILVGGGSQGRDARIANAQRVDIDKGVQLSADATQSGTGGTVVAWSDDRLTYRGAISARGAGAGAGGRVEVDAGRRLVFEGTVDVAGGAGSPPLSGQGLPNVPRSGQPAPVQVALSRVEAEALDPGTAAVMRQPISSQARDPYKRRVVVDAVQCRGE